MYHSLLVEQSLKRVHTGGLKKVQSVFSTSLIAPPSNRATQQPLQAKGSRDLHTQQQWGKSSNANNSNNKSSTRISSAWWVCWACYLVPGRISRRAEAARAVQQSSSSDNDRERRLHVCREHRPGHQQLPLHRLSQRREHCIRAPDGARAVLPSAGVRRARC